MNILVTGGAGYIGSHTCLELLRRGHAVVVVDNLINAQKEAIDRVRELANIDFPFYEMDVRDESALNDVFKRH
jgi:UDP-glucose 4-epimerase